jgi:hypothetical protein
MVWAKAAEAAHNQAITLITKNRMFTPKAPTVERRKSKFASESKANVQICAAKPAHQHSQR